MAEEDVSIAAAAALVIRISNQFATLSSQLNEWAAGVPTGGPNGDGKYPITNPDGVTRLIPSPGLISTLTRLSQEDLDLLELAAATSRNSLYESQRKATIFRQEGQPPAPRYGDEWINPSNFFARKWYDGNQWLPSSAGGSDGDSSSAIRAFATADMFDGPRIGSTAYQWQDVIAVTGRLTGPSKVTTFANLTQSYSGSGALPLNYETRILLTNSVYPEGRNIRGAGGLPFAQENLSVAQILSVAEGDFELKLQWRGSKTNIRLMQGSIMYLAL